MIRQPSPSSSTTLRALMRSMFFTGTRGWMQWVTPCWCCPILIIKSSSTNCGTQSTPSFATLRARAVVIFHHSCETDFSACSDDVDTFGVFYVVTSLFIAESRWGGGTYAAAANEMLTTMQSKEANGIVEGVLNLFAPDGLPRRSPFEGEAPDVWSGSLMPAFFELWYVYSHDPFWHDVAVHSRTLLQLVAHPDTGLSPERVDRITGQPSQEMPEFREGCFGVGFHMALDQAWIGPQSGYSASADRLVGFFAPRSPGYPAQWTIQGEALNAVGSGALIALNGAAASIATVDAREAMMRSVWEMTLTTGTYRYSRRCESAVVLDVFGGQLTPR